jgi:hypothetical protein
MQQGGDWDDKEIQRFIRRDATFTKHGLKEKDAGKLAEQLLYRDRGDDDRRVCFECSHMRKTLLCDAGEPALPFILQRCPKFTAR